MAGPILWSAFYSVGDSTLDDQHKQIIEMINDVFTASEQGKGSEAVRAVLARLCAYVEVHFAYEEQVMRENGFPELPQHRLLHDKLRQQTLNLVEEMDHLTSHSMLQFLKEWFVEHILNQDKKLARHLARVAQSLPA